MLFYMIYSIVLSGSFYFFIIAVKIVPIIPHFS